MHTTNEQHESNTTATARAKTICKLGLDAHAASITVARQLDGANPQRPQRFPVPKFLAWVEEQVKQGYQVISCYEAGPTGYWLHRKLEKLGVTNYVVCPTKLDSRCKGVSNDSRDALELLVRLDRYVAGNREAFSGGGVPTVAPEQKRALGRGCEAHPRNSRLQPRPQPGADASAIHGRTERSGCTAAEPYPLSRGSKLRHPPRPGQTKPQKQP